MTTKEVKDVAKPDADAVAKAAAAALPAALPAAAPPQPKAEAEFKLVKTVHGDMHDPHTGTNYSFMPKELLKASGWVDSQIAAGKMVYVD